MEPKKEKINSKDETRALRKKIKRVEESRSSIKTKSQEKGKVIKMYQDRQSGYWFNFVQWVA